MSTKSIRFSVQRLVLSAVLLALSLILPILTGQLAQFGRMLLPMHLPILLCGFCCGPGYALFTGLFAPLLRFALFGMPQPVPTGLCMAVELAAYGGISGFLYERMKNRAIGCYFSLIVSMLLGRICWAGACMLLYPLLCGTSFTFSMFLAGAFAQAWPGILLQLILIPLLVKALEKAKLFHLKKEKKE